MAKKIRAKANAYTALSNALDYAVHYGCNRHDKYAEREKCLDQQTRDVLYREIDSAFFLYLEENGYVFE